MAFCSQCGAKINDTVKFCPECGAKIIEGTKINNEDNQTDNAIKQNAEKADANQNKSNKVKLYIGLGIGLIAIVLLCIFLIPAISNSKKHENIDVSAKEIETTETEPVAENKPKVIDSTETIYKEIKGTWERVERYGVAFDEEEPDVKFYFDIKLSIKFSDDNKGVIELKLADTEKSVEKKAYEYSKELYNSMLAGRGVTNYSAYVTPTGVAYDDAVNKLYNDIIHPTAKNILASNTLEFNEPFRYIIKDNVIYYEDGSKLGDYYVVEDCIYIKSEEILELMENLFGGSRGDYISFEKAK